ncbi:Protein MLT-11 f [Aphelenchoides avenae]|nr:Protein MLT-11 f [Aphelenchus avenae]
MKRSRALSAALLLLLCVSLTCAGHCANDDSEPKLFRYKEECEDACINVAAGEEGTEPPHIGGEYTYATVGSPVADSNDGSTTAYEVPKTECQRQRDLKGEGFVKGGFVPECTESGEFKPLQCEQDGQTCFCVNKDGIEIENSRSPAGQPKPDCEKIGNATPMRTNECTGASDTGPCSASISRWYYDELDQQCKSFKYSGCGGNGNNYPSETSCQRRCVPPSDGAKCHRGTEPLKTSQGQLVNCAKTDCPAGYKCSVIQQNSVCCPDVEKSPVAGVLHSGTDPNVCGLPKERGPCDHYELRFYYNKEIGECKYFFYGGCEGNSNNFAKIEDCEKACVGGCVGNYRDRGAVIDVRCYHSSRVNNCGRVHSWIRVHNCGGVNH